MQVSTRCVHYAQLPPLKVTATSTPGSSTPSSRRSTSTGICGDDDTYRQTLRETMINSESMMSTSSRAGSPPKTSDPGPRLGANARSRSTVEKTMIAQLAPVPDDQRDRLRTRSSTSPATSPRRTSSSFTINYQSTPPSSGTSTRRGRCPTSPASRTSRASRWPGRTSPQRSTSRTSSSTRQRVDVLRQRRLREAADPQRRGQARLRGQADAAHRGRGRNGEAVFKKPDDLAKFATYVRGGTTASTAYSYQVNYKGTSRSTSPRRS